MILSALADSVVQLSFLRLTTGLGVGGMHATIATLASEFSPRRHSAAAVMTVTAGYPAGAMLFGLAANYLLAPFGWQSLFVAAGLCSVALIPIAFVFAPESSDFLLNRRREGDLERANRVLAMQGRPELAAYPAMARMTARRNPFLSLFHRDVRVTTLLCWTAFVGAIFVVYFLLSWIPRVATRTGYSLETAIYGSSIFNGGAVVGLILVGWLTARWNLGKVIATLYLLAAASMIVFAQWNTPVSVFYGVLFAMGLFQQSGNGALYAVVTRVYGAEVRTTALGWAVGIGRGGAVLGPAAGGLAMSAGLSVGWMFVVFSLPLLLAAACSLAIGIKHFSR
jgi:MFS family permease